jgi:dipeptidyl aminopeptidase/acylaminoacyl peptidase
LIAFSGGTSQSRAESDTEIYVVAPDGTGLRALTSTPGVPEVAPAWSPDGTRLAFLRDEREGGVELVVIDPATGDETFSVDLPIPPPSHVTVPPEWSPDGRLIVVSLHSLAGLAVDLETGTWTTFDGSYLGWSPSGTMSPNGSADGQLRALIEDGVAPSWSPDGSHIAYLRCLDVPDPVDMPRDTVPADLAGVDPGQSGASVWVAAADGTGARAVATSLVPPMWSPDGSLLIVGDDGLFTVRPDGTGMTRLTRVMTPKKEGAYSGLTACGGNLSGDANPWLAVAGWFGPVFQPMSPSADVGADVATTDPTETMPARTTTDVIATEESATTDG